MRRASVEVAHIFRRYGESYRSRHRLPLQQHRLMRAIECCRTADLGGHLDRCNQCGHQRISYNSCRNRHCPKCQNTARAEWVGQRKAELLPIEYFHVVFTIPRELNLLTLHNKALLYKLLFDASATTLLTIAADPRHLGARIGFFSVLHTWGQNLLDHPHVHCVATGGGLGADGTRWVACRPGFFLPVRVLSRLFRRLFIEGLRRLLSSNQLRLAGAIEPLRLALPGLLDRLARTEWVVYAKPPFGGPAQVIEYLGRYTHRVAISNQRLLSLENGRVCFACKDYRSSGRSRNRTLTLETDEFIRRFLLHTLPPGFARIRHYGILAGRNKRHTLPLCLSLLLAPELCLPTAPEIVRCKAQILEVAFRCPRCQQGIMVRLGRIPRCRPAPAAANSS
jgi:Putative transposase/Transposase zinc-binding domain